MMKTKNIILAASAGILLTGCTTVASTLGQAALGQVIQGAASNQNTNSTTTNNGSSGILGNVLGAVTNGDALGNILGSVLGTDKMTAARLYGTWKYAQPGVAFTSDQLLAKAGGEVAASQIKEKLQTYYQSTGISASNTQITLNEDKTFSMTLMGKSLSGTYTLDETQGLITLKTLIFSIPAYVKGSTTGMSLLFEADKLLTLIQALATISGSTELQAIGELSKNYDGLRLGFDMSK